MIDDQSNLLKAALGYDLVLVGNHTMAKGLRQDSRVGLYLMRQISYDSSE